jgi:hypothetical protein
VAEGGTSKQNLQVYINYLRTLQSPWTLWHPHCKYGMTKMKGKTCHLI